MEQEKLEIKHWKPVKEYALSKGVIVQTVYNWIKKNKVDVKKIGSYHLVRDK